MDNEKEADRRSTGSCKEGAKLNNTTGMIHGTPCRHVPSYLIGILSDPSSDRTSKQASVRK